MTRKKNRNGVARGVCHVDTKAVARADAELRRAVHELSATNARYAASSVQQRAGRAAETWHAATLQQDATLKGVRLSARTTASMGLPHAKPDILVTATRPGPPVAAQVKYAGTAAKSGIAQARADYGGMQRVVPADQLAQAQERVGAVSRRLAAKGDARAPRFADAAANLTDRVHAGSAESTPLTRAGAEQLAIDPGALARHGQLMQLKHAAKSGAVSSGVSGAVVALMVHGAEVAGGRSTLGDAAIGVASDTAVSALKGAVTAVGGGAIATGAARVGFGALARSSAPVAIAATALDAGCALGSYATGNVSGQECADRVARSVTTGAATWAGGELGMLVGTAICPGFGTAVGGLVGGLGAALGIGALFKK